MQKNANRAKYIIKTDILIAFFDFFMRFVLHNTNDISASNQVSIILILIIIQ